MIKKITILKQIDSLIGKQLIHAVRFIIQVRGNIPEIHRILLIRPGGIGDAVLLLPAIRSLKEKFPNAEIDILCEKRNAGVFTLSNDINRIYLYDKGLGLFKCLKNRYDAVIDTEQWHRLSAVVAYISKAPVRIGFSTNERDGLFTHRIHYSQEDYEVNSFFHLIEPLVGNTPDFNTECPFINLNEDVPDRLLTYFRKGSGEIVSISPGASAVERRWGGERFGQVAKTLNASGYRVAILGSQTDKTDAEKIKRYAPECIDLTGITTLKDAAYILKLSRLLITSDSGIMHIAYGVGTPTVSLFGSGIEKKWAPRGKRHVVLNKNLKCSPCTRFGYTPRCKKNADCMKQIAEDGVLKKALDLLEGET